ncbi:MAG: PIG-L family deacetylase [Dehalococcoidales bacterium]|nr:MAG: PIG-L family deacetylase [Dehalococcoidales bacterium]
MTKQAQVIVFIPHPDDAESRMAGTVARWAREGKDIIYAVCTNGDKGTSDPDMEPEELAKVREKEQLAAAEVLGVREVEFLRYPDQTLEDTPELRKDMVRLIRKYRLETVVTVDPYRGYLDHRDHRMTAQVTLDAVYPYAASTHSYPDLLEQGLQPHRIKEVLFCGTSDPNYYIDITDTIDIKIAALRCHKSQVGDRPEMSERMKQRARMSAEGQDYELAEAFHREVMQW